MVNLMHRAIPRPRRGSRLARGLLATLLLAVIAAFALSACGGTDDDAAAGGATAGETTNGGDGAADARPAGGYVWAGTEEETEEARQAGERDAGEPVDPPRGKSIGIIQLSGQSATSLAVTDAAKEIAELFGYKVHVCDPNFDPQKVPQCATSIVSQNPSVIFSVSQNPGPMGSAVREAAARGIPWFGTGSASTKSPHLNDYGIDGFEIAKVLDEWLISRIQERGEAAPKKIFAITAPTVGQASLNQENQLKEDVRAASGVELIKHDLDLANAVQDTLNVTRQTLEQNPDLAATWTLCDFCIPLMAQVVEQKQGADRRTLVAGLFSNPETIADIRRGGIDAVGDYAWALPVWVAMDQVLQHWTRGERIVEGFDVFRTYPLPFMEPYVITRENALDSGPAPIYGPDFETYFRTKWAKEFGVGS